MDAARLRDPALAGALVAAVVAVYAPVGGYGYVPYDDPLFVTANPALSLGFSWEGLGWALTTLRAVSWMPLTWLSYFLDGAWHGLDPGGVHRTQLILHAAAAVGLFAALRRLTAAPWASACVAGIFALHPLNVESVAWVSERKGVLAGSFWMWALWLHAGTGPGEASPRRRAAVTVVGLCALLSKPMAVTLPFTLLLLDYWPLGRFGGPGGMDLEAGVVRRRLREKVPLFGAALAVSALTWIGQSRAAAMAPLASLGAGERVANALRAYLAYLESFLWPRDLAVLYPLSPDPSAVRLGLALVAMGSLSALALWQRRRRPWVAVGWFWFLGTLVPVIGLVQVGSQTHADRYAYVPCIGLALALVFGVREALASPRARIGASLGALALLVALGGAASAQRAHWRDGVSLFAHALSVVGPHPIVLEQLGTALADAGREVEARRHLEHSHALRPKAVLANNLAWSYATHPDPALRRPERALELARFAVSQERHVPEYLGTLAAAQAASGRFDLAERWQRRALAEARAAGREAFVEVLEGPLALYLEGRPYVEPR